MTIDLRPKNRRYSQWAGNPQGSAEDTTRCVAQVGFGERGANHRQCSKPRGHGPDGLWCRQHDPGRLAKKEELVRRYWRDRDRSQAEVEKKAKALARKLGAGEPVYASGRTFRDSGYVERLSISFDEAERIIARLEGKS